MAAAVKITVLIENTASGPLVGEHGLSLWIEHGGKKILLDTGKSEAFSANAEAMGIDTASADICVLSHGHYDHSGGFGAVFRKNVSVRVYAQKDVLCPYFSGSGGRMHPIGVPEEVAGQSGRFDFLDGFREISGGVFLVPHSAEGLEEIGKRAGLYKKVGEEMLPDSFSHEQSLVVDTEKGLVVFNSCSHGGVANIIREARNACGGKTVCAYVGGMHMKGKKGGVEICTFSEEELDELCGCIRKEGLRYVYTGHCTGKPGVEQMRERLGDIVRPLYTGMIIEL